VILFARDIHSHQVSRSQKKSEAAYRVGAYPPASVFSLLQPFLSTISHLKSLIRCHRRLAFLPASWVLSSNSSLVRWLAGLIRVRKQASPQSAHREINYQAKRGHSSHCAIKSLKSALSTYPRTRSPAPPRL